jgi:hypothetical protein
MGQLLQKSSSSIIWGLYDRPEVAAVPSGLSPTPLLKKKEKQYSFNHGVPFLSYTLYFIKKIENSPLKSMVN